MNKFWKHILLIFAAVVFLLAAYILFLFFIPNFHQKGKEKQYLFLREGAVYNDVVSQLKKKSTVFSMFSFNQVSNILNYTNNVKSGRYLIPNGASNFTLIRTLRSGRQTPVQLTFNNIRTKEQLAGRLSKQLMPDSVQFLKLLNDTAFLSKYNLNPYTSISIFLPNTYQIFWNTSVENIFERMYKEYNKFWTPERNQKASEIPLTQSEVITLASIVDAESNTSFEKPIIAGLYINRLRKSMPLQADPTIIFAAGDFSIKRVTGTYTSIKSPYNTYKNRGLPPGPIRIPDLKTIDAVLNYDKNDYVYMCAKETLNGEHNFSSNWAEHQQNAKKYQQALNERGIH
ncbi:Aminodeoxychorismate lyase [uncultured Paludibacter sp.]|nr:Aminodeoxychorismate lyase [uncultured Paludibacter sp.]